MVETNNVSAASALAAAGMNQQAIKDEGKAPSATPTLAAAGYDRTGYISGLTLSDFTAPLKDVKTTNLSDQVLKYAQEREKLRDEKIDAQALSAYGQLSTSQQMMMDDIYDFYGKKADTTKGAFMREMFDMSGRMSNKGVQDAINSKLNTYTNDMAAFQADAKRIGYDAVKDAGMVFGWGDKVGGEASLYANSRTAKARAEAAKKAAMEQFRQYYRQYSGRDDTGGSWGKEAYAAWGRMRSANPVGMTDAEMAGFMSQAAEAKAQMDRMRSSGGGGRSGGGGVSSSGARGSMGRGSDHGESKGRGMGGR